MSRTLRTAVLAVLSTLLVMAGSAAPAAGGGGGGCYAEELTDEAATQVKVGANCFSPVVTRVDPGDRVTWYSGEREAPHTVTGVAGGFGSQDLPAEGRVGVTFDEPGVFPYACLLHPGMVGVVVVGDGITTAGVAGEEAPAGGTPATAGAPAAAVAVPRRTAPVVAAALALSLAVALLLRRRRTPSAPL